jgi:hypothetical protein
MEQICRQDKTSLRSDGWFAAVKCKGICHRKRISHGSIISPGTTANQIWGKRVDGSENVIAA